MSTDDRILDAALRVFEEVGLRGATTRKIAEVAGVNEVTLFRRFGSKEQLLMEAIRRQGERGTPMLPEVPVDVPAELVVWCITHVQRLSSARLLFRSTLNETNSHPQVCAAAHEGPKRIAADLAAYLDRARAAGLANGDWDARDAATMLMGALFAEAVVQPAVRPDAPDRSAREIAHEFVRLFVRSIGAESPAALVPPAIATEPANEGTPT